MFDLLNVIRDRTLLLEYKVGISFSLQVPRTLFIESSVCEFLFGRRRPAQGGF